MAKDKKMFNKNLLIMCIVPVLVLVVTMSIIGVSYAWFNKTEKTTIASLSLSASETFKMVFEIETVEDKNGYNISTIIDPATNKTKIYNGQTAFDENGMLVTQVHAIEKFGWDDPNNELRQKYLNDSAFVAPFVLKLDTNTYRTENGQSKFVRENQIDFNCIIESVHIQNSKNSAIEINMPGNNGTPDDTTDDISVDDIKLGFTWYIATDDIWYTPYGMFDHRAQADKDGSGPIDTENWEPVGVTEFQANKEESYTFNIVFAPEILYWKQYGSNEENNVAGVAEYDETIYDIYEKDEENIYGIYEDDMEDVFASGKWDAVNRYSSSIYSGSTYSFTVLLTVTKVVPIN